MKKLMIFMCVMFMFSFVVAEKSVEYYWGIGCPHCKVIADSGILEKVNQTVLVTKYESWYDVANKQRFEEMLSKYDIPASSRGVPFALINCDGKIGYLVGDNPIINNLESYVETCNFEPVSQKNNSFIYWAVALVIALAIFVWWMLRKK